MDSKEKNTTALEEIKKSIEEIKAAAKTLGEQGKLNDEVQVNLKKINEDMEDLKKKTIERQLSLKGVDDEKKPFDLAIAIKCARLNNWKEAGYELEVIQQTQKVAKAIGFRADDPTILEKDLTAGTGVNGGFLLPVEVEQGIVPLAIANRPILNDMGITRINNIAAGEYRINKQTTRGQAYWIGELQAPGKSNQQFDQRILRMKKIAAYSAASNDLLRQGRGTSDGFLKSDLSDALGLGLETALFAGTGTDYQPRGITKYEGLTPSTALGAAGKQFGIRDAAKMINNIRKANLLKGSLGFVMAPDVLLGLYIQGAQSYSGQTTNTPPIVIGSPILSQAQLEQLVGYKIRTSTLIPINGSKSGSTDLSSVLFGDFSQVVLGMWGGLEIKMSNEASDGTYNMFTQDGFFVHVLQTADIVIRDEAAFTLIEDARTSLQAETV